MTKLDDFIWYARKCVELGVPYTHWDGFSGPGPGAPFWMQSAGASYADVVYGGSHCAGFLNLLRCWVGLDGVGGTPAWEDFLRAGGWFEDFDAAKPYPAGTVLLQPWGTGAGAEGHIGFVSTSAQGFIDCNSYYGAHESSVEHQHYYTPFSYAAFMPDLLPVEAGGSTDPKGPKEYPGDWADPDEVGRWMARVAYEDYGLPPELPVMTSYVELTDAWTSPGYVWNLNGYGNQADHTSLGYFQQQDNWGTYEERTDAPTALKLFCEAALADWHSVDANDADALGEWCADVQRPLESLRYKYAYYGYPAAKELIKGWNEGGSVPEPVPGPVPDPVPPPGEKTYGGLWSQLGYYTWANMDDWNLTYYDKDGKANSSTGPVVAPKEEWHKAHQKPEPVEYRATADGKVEVRQPGQAVITITQDEFEREYDTVEEKK